MQSLGKMLTVLQQFLLWLRRINCSFIKTAPRIPLPPPNLRPPLRPPSLLRRSRCLVSRPLRGSLSPLPFSQFLPAAAVTRDQSCGWAVRGKKRKSQTLLRRVEWSGVGGFGGRLMNSKMGCFVQMQFVLFHLHLPVSSLAFTSNTSPGSPVRKIPLQAPGLKVKMSILGKVTLGNNAAKSFLYVCAVFFHTCNRMHPV